MKAMTKATECESVSDQMQVVSFQSELLKIKRAMRSDEVIHERENNRSLPRNGKQVKTVKDGEAL